MATEDLTTFTEVDNGADLTVTAAKVDVVNQPGNVENYVYVDRGAAYYSGDFNHDFEHYVSEVNTSAAGLFIGVSDQIGTMQAGPSFFTAINSNGLLPYLIEVDSAGNLDLVVAGSALTIDTLYYSTFKRVGNTLTWDIYTDSDRTSLHQSLTGTIVNTSQTFQYFYAESAYSVSETATATYYVQNIDYKEVAVITGTGSHQATTATSSGTGERIVNGSGTAQASTAIGSGIAERIITGTGIGQAETATSVGTVERVIVGSGSHQAEAAISSGVGIGGGISIGSGDHQASTAISSGIGERKIVGLGNSQATYATSTGVALRVITGTGLHQADAATSEGSVGVDSISVKRISAVITIVERKQNSITVNQDFSVEITQQKIYGVKI